ncbi:hypothetical protein [Paraburkholderia graminis]|jgi:hypothetical protein|uniref:hypothetical protein n=1 Tax=Paraburkholderia graminis TaxID=60548 RepID=UPI001F91330C|nr:hypothetical protein [Burkholderia sp.]
MTPVKFEPKMRDMNSVHELSVKTLGINRQISDMDAARDIDLFDRRCGRPYLVTQLSVHFIGHDSTDNRTY